MWFQVFRHPIWEAALYRSTSTFVEILCHNLYCSTAQRMNPFWVVVIFRWDSMLVAALVIMVLVPSLSSLVVAVECLGRSSVAPLRAGLHRYGNRRTALVRWLARVDTGIGSPGVGVQHLGESVRSHLQLLWIPVGVADFLANGSRGPSRFATDPVLPVQVGD